MLVYDIDGPIKGCTKKDMSAMFKGTSKKRRIFEIQNPERDNDANFCIDTVMNKDSITRNTECKLPDAKLEA